MIIDFGIAIEIGDYEISKQFAGTVKYMAPDNECKRARNGWKLKKVISVQIGWKK